MRRFLAALPVVAMLALAPAARAGEEPKVAITKVDARAAFERMKTFVGEWKVAPPRNWVITYRLTGAGTALIETFFPGTQQEMTSVYYVDGDDLVMTHYCAAGNQPRMKLDRAASTPDRLQFAFDGGSNLTDGTPHVHQGWIAFKDEDHHESEWIRFLGKKPMPAELLSLSRMKEK